MFAQYDIYIFFLERKIFFLPTTLENPGKLPEMTLFFFLSCHIIHACICRLDENARWKSENCPATQEMSFNMQSSTVSLGGGGCPTDETFLTRSILLLLKCTLLIGRAAIFPECFSGLYFYLHWMSLISRYICLIIEDCIGWSTYGPARTPWRILVQPRRSKLSLNIVIIELDLACHFCLDIKRRSWPWVCWPFRFLIELWPRVSHNITGQDFCIKASLKLICWEHPQQEAVETAWFALSSGNNLKVTRSRSLK